MEFEVFSKELKNKAEQINIVLEEKQIENFYKYMNLLLEWNEKMNLTAITEPNEIILKHFVDSATILKNIKSTDKVVDVGSGAGFPGIPVKILNKNISFTLLDSLNKRIKFLDEVIYNLKLNAIETVHSRAEDFAKESREIFDVAVSRAVAPLNILLEYMLPLVKVGGICICMKGSNIGEMKDCRKALEILGGEIEKIEELYLPGTDNKRNIIIVQKIKETPKKYPRKAGKPTREPII